MQKYSPLCLSVYLDLSETTGKFLDNENFFFFGKTWILPFYFHDNRQKIRLIFKKKFLFGFPVPLLSVDLDANNTT